MKVRHLPSGHWPRLLITLLAVVNMLAHAAIPLPAGAHAYSIPGAELKLLEAAFCHAGEGGGDHTPAPVPACDHCPVCGIAAHVPPPAVADNAPPSMPPVPELAMPAGLHRHASPRAPPEFARGPRAPPML